MKKGNLSSTASTQNPSSTRLESDSPSQDVGPRRSFLKGLGIAGATLGAGTLLANPAIARADDHSGSLTRGDAAILRFWQRPKSSRPTSGCNTRNSGAPRTPNSQVLWAETRFTPRP